MVDTTVRARLPRTAVTALVKGLPSILSGRSPDPYGIKMVFLNAFAATLFKLIRRAYQDKAGEGIQGGTDEFGKSWKPLSPATIKRDKYRKVARIGLLRLDDRLKKSLDPGVLIGGLYFGPSEQILRVEGNVLTLGTKVPYGVYHHQGTARMPSRRLWPSTRDIGRWNAQAAQAGVEAVVAKLASVV